MMTLVGLSFFTESRGASLLLNVLDCPLISVPKEWKHQRCRSTVGHDLWYCLLEEKSKKRDAVRKGAARKISRRYHAVPVAS